MQEKNIIIPQDYFAELYVAGLLANAMWNVYFPHRDKGMDFIISKTGTDGKEIIRPVQVKGKYPSLDKGNKATYGEVTGVNRQLSRMENQLLGVTINNSMTTLG